MAILRAILKNRSPSLYGAAGRIWQRLQIEYNVLRHLRLSDVARLFGRDRGEWRVLLPLQKIRTISIAGVAISDWQQLVEHLECTGIPYCIGGHTIYFPLAQVRHRDSGLAILADLYPADAGIKLLKNTGAAADGYVHGREHSKLQLALLNTIEELMLVANMLHAYDIGPRLYDLVDLEMGGTRWRAFVTQHICGHQPTSDQCRAFLARLRALVDERWLSIVAPNGFRHNDFQCPGCNGNLLADDNGKTYFVDFQNFVLHKYSAYLAKVGLAATKATCQNTDRTGRRPPHLYQSIPGAAALPSKRDTDLRWSRIAPALRAAGEDIEGRVVLDVGCNIGMMISQYLRCGASWCHGWDRPEVISHAEPTLLALGCTRFSLTGREITEQDHLLEDVPDYLLSQLNGCVVSCLSVRGCLGWIECLHDIPWSLMIYEGHQNEGEQIIVETLNKCIQRDDVTIVSVTAPSEGDPDPRVLAILRRTQALV